jgi:hypothetical protein
VSGIYFVVILEGHYRFCSVSLEFIECISFDVYAEIAEMLFLSFFDLACVFFLNSLGYYIGILCHSVDRLTDPLICCHQNL